MVFDMLEKKMEETYEGMLFMYGISCAENLVNLGKITKADYDKIMEYHRKGEVPPREFVQRVFAAAVERIGDEKTPEAVERYFVERHNSIIDRREGSYAKMPDVLCDACKVRDGEIIGIDNFKGVSFPVYKIRYENGEDIAFGKYFRYFRVGERVRTHNKSVVKRL